MKLKSIIGIVIPLLLSCTATGTEIEPGGGINSRPAKFANDNEMLDYIQKVHFNYMWDGAEEVSGLAPERIHLDNIYPENDSKVVTIGGSGFGVAGLLVAIDRGFVSREEGVKRLTKIADYLTRADRFHGVWPHWLDGPTGKVKPFGTKDNGGDLVESCFMMQSLLCVRQYFMNGNAEEKALANKVDKLWREMEFDWYQNGKDVIYWHWSPSYGWEMNFPLEGYNETMIVYILAAASPTHTVAASAYHNGWARGGNIKSNAKPYGYALELKHNGAEEFGGPLFWAQYSWIGLDPRNLKDKYANYWNVTRNHVMANYKYCVTNPKRFKGYGDNCWGLTASYSVKGYNAHFPGNDHGVITPTAALSSFPYSPKESMSALKHFYFDKGAWIWGKYGFYDAFSDESAWTTPRYLAIDQCTIAPMIENYRSGLLWKLFMSCPEVQSGLTKLGFTY
ncbi:MAG: glucoamylase family protein [Muribaculaceae bacterium]